jgi:cell division protein FtsZ
VLINITGGANLTLHEVAEAARTIAEAVDPDANIISGLVVEPVMEDEMKVTVIATGFGYTPEVRASPRSESFATSGRTERVAAPSSTSNPFQESAQEEPEDDVPFYRKVIAQSHEDSGGFGPNWSNVDDYDIPTVLRKQMD